MNNTFVFVAIILAILIINDVEGFGGGHQSNYTSRDDFIVYEKRQLV